MDFQSKEFAKELQRAEFAAVNARTMLVEFPGVLSIGAGLERRKGVTTGKVAIIITVKRKLSKKDLENTGQKMLPEEVEGIPIDVVEEKAAIENRQARKKLDNVIKVKERIVNDWINKKNINGMGVGYKKVKGKVTDRLCIQFFVDKKLSAAQLKKQNIQPVPASLKGIPTDVVEMEPSAGSSEAGSRGNRQGTLAGGISVGCNSMPWRFGTLAALVFDGSNNTLALSNEHVLDGPVGDDVMQPGVVNLGDLDVDFQLDVCNPLNFVRIDTPNTTAGSVLAAAAVAAATAAALSDEIDPTREGQQKVNVAPGVDTVAELADVKINYHQYPLPGTPFKLDVSWKYTRSTTAGDKSKDFKHARENPHYLEYHKLFVNKKKYPPSDIIQLLGVIIPGDGNPDKKRRPKCSNMFCIGYISPVKYDQTYPVVLTNIDFKTGERLVSLFENVDASDRSLINEAIKKQQQICFYYGRMPAENLPLGPWFHWMYVQTTNDVYPGTDPLVAAQTIGGLPLSTNIDTATLDIACGPFVLEDDGSFDIEIFSL